MVNFDPEVAMHPFLQKKNPWSVPLMNITDKIPYRRSDLDFQFMIRWRVECHMTEFKKLF